MSAAPAAQRPATGWPPGSDQRGQSRRPGNCARSGAGTGINIEANVSLAGAVAQFGRSGLIKEISNRLIGEFAQCLEGKLSAVTVEEAAQVQAGEVKGIQLFFQTLAARIKRLFSRSE